MTHPLDPVLYPRTIAIIGASKDPAKRGYRALKTLLTDAFDGRIFPINPKEREILDVQCHPSLDAVPEDIDLAIVCTAASTTPDMVEACGRKGVKGALLLAGGFSEASEAGRLLEERTVAIARRHGVRLIGPNTAGMFTARHSCNAYGRPDIPRGPLALVSNSANVLRSLELEIRFHGHSGISAMLSVGNQADLQFHEYLDCFGEDPDTRAIVSYIEGFKDGPAYLAAARRVCPRKPIVVYAVGRTAEGKGAARSHSGSLSADYAVTRGVLRQAGVVLVEQSDHLFPVADALMLFPQMRGRRVAVLSEGGGPISIAAETLAQCGLELATLTPETQAKIHSIVPNATAIANPVDAGGGTDPRVEYYGSISRLILEDPNIDALLLVGFFGGYVTAPTRYGADIVEVEAAIGVALAADMHRLGKPVMVQSHYAHLKTSSLDALRKAGVPYERHVETAVRCLAHAAAQGEMQRRLALAAATSAGPARMPAAGAIVALATAEGRDLLEPEARALLAAHGVPMAPSVLMKDAGDAADAVARLGGVPLALKIVSRDVLHKSDVGGVRLDVTGAAAVAAAFDGIVGDVRAIRPDADVAGVLATPMAPRGVELIVGMVQDPQYGRVLVAGLGGVFVEAMRDVVFRAVPVSEADAFEMLEEIRAQAMLDGVRGLPAVDRAAIAGLLVKVSALAEAHAEIGEIDLNPVIAHGEGYAVVDARMLLQHRSD